MANDQESIEKIRLELETNFEDTLKKTASQYSNFVKQVGDMSKSIGSAFNSLGSEVSKNLNVMTKASVKEISEGLSSIETLMKNVSKSGIAANKEYLSSIIQLKKAQKEYADEIMRVESNIKKQSAAVKKDPENKVLKKVLTQSQDKKTKIEDEFYGLHAEVTNKMNLKTGELARNSSEVLVKNAETALKVIEKTAEGSVNAVKKVENQMGMMSKTEGLLHLTSQCHKMEEQYESTQKTMLNQSKLRVDAEKKLEQSKTAFVNQQSKKYLRHNEGYFTQTGENQIVVQENYEKSRVAVQKFGNEVDKVKNKGKALAKELRSELKDAIPSPSELSRSVNIAMNHMAEYVKASNKNMRSAMTDSIINFDKDQSAIQNKITQLESLRKEMLLVKESGFIDKNTINRDIRSIDKVIEAYKNASKQIQSEQKKVQDVFSHPEKSVLRQTGLKDYYQTKRDTKQSQEFISDTHPVTDKNIYEMKENVDNLNKNIDIYKNKYAALIKAKEKLDIESEEVRKLITETTNEKLLASYNSYYNKLQAKKASIDKALSYSKGADFSKEAKEQMNKIIAKAHEMQSEIQKSFLTNKAFPQEEFDRIKSQYDKLMVTVGKLNRSHFVSDSSINEAKSGLELIQSEIRKYTLMINGAENALKELNQLSSKGLGGSGIKAQADALKEQIQLMKTYASNLTKMSSQAQNNIDKITRTSAKGLMSSAWEGIRNFRWQVAAGMYIISNAIGATKRMFFNVIDEIQKFSTDAAGVAAGIAFNMVGNTKEAFQNAYEFSKDLLLKVQLEASKTMLSLEDMIMMLKTFTQAGIIPKTDKDVENIATIGSAIKALTEGMANAGTQMRQELNAVIMGRQRVTDQLAMMFKQQGVDIQKVIDDARDSGESMITALAGALEPFKEMNEAISDQYIIQTNRLKVIWSLIKRIGGEPVLKDMAKHIKKINDSLLETGSNQLTQLGQDAAKAMEAFLTMLKEIGIQFLELVKTINIFFEMVGDVGASLGLWKETQSSIGNELSGLINTFEIIAKSIVVVNSFLRFTLTTTKRIVGAVVEILTGIGLIAGILTSNPFLIIASSLGMVFQVYKKITNDSPKVKKSLNEDILDPIREAKAEVIRLGEEFNKLRNRDFSINKGKNLIETFLGAPYKKSGQFAEDLKKVSEDYKKISSKMIGPEKYDQEFKEATERYEKNRKKIQTNINVNESILQRPFIYNLTDQDKKRVQIEIDDSKKSLDEMNANEQEARGKRDQDIKQWNDKILNDERQFQKQYNSLLLELTSKPEFKADSITKWHDEAVIKIEDIIANTRSEGKLTPDLEEMLFKGLDTGYLKQSGQIIRDITSDIDDMLISVTSHRELGAFKNIEIEFDKTNKAIEEKINKEIEAFESVLEVGKNDSNISKETLDSIIAQVEYLKIKRDLLIENRNTSEQERTTQLRINTAYEQKLSLMDIEQKKLDLMARSKNPAMQLQAEIGTTQLAMDKLNTESTKQFEDLQKQYEQIGTQKLEDIQNILNGQKRIIAGWKVEAATLQDIQWHQLHPLFTELEELSVKWADDLSNALTDIAMDFDNLSDSIRNLEESITRDFLHAFIKTKLVEPLMKFSTDKDSGSNWFMGLIGQDKKSTGTNPEIEKASAKLSENEEKMKTAFSSALSTTTMTTKILDQPLSVIVSNIKSFELNDTNKSISDQAKTNEQTNNLAAEQIQSNNQVNNTITNETDKQTSALSSAFNIIGDKLYGGFSEIVNAITGLYSIFSGGGGGGNSGNIISSIIGSTGSNGKSGSGLVGLIGGLFSSSGSGGSGLAASGGAIGSTAGSDAIASWFTGIAGSGITADEGGIIKEPVVGKGMRSGKTYQIVKNGQPEAIVPLSKYNESVKGKSKGNANINVSMNINQNNLDTRTGVQFLMENMDVIEAKLGRSLKNNRTIRNLMRGYT